MNAIGHAKARIETIVEPRTVVIVGLRHNRHCDLLELRQVRGKPIRVS
jgi:hypothetical protein